MADNITLNSGTGGATLAADDISGTHHQRVKIQYGVDGSATDVSDTNPLPIDDAGGSITIDNAALSVTGTGNESTALRVTIATDSTGVLSVDDNGGALTVDNAGTFAVQVDAALPAGTNAIGKLAANSGVDIGDVDVLTMPGTAAEGAALPSSFVVVAADDGTDTVPLQATAGGDLKITLDSEAVVLGAGSAAIGKLAANSGVDIGDVDILSIAAGANLVGDVGISGARTSGGTTIFRSLDLDESEEEVKATAGQVYWIHAMNLASSKRYLKVYNATAATVVVGTTTPVLTFPLATQGDTNGAGFMFSVPNGVAFGTAITVAATTGVADNDTGAPGANEVVVNIGYA